MAEQINLASLIISIIILIVVVILIFMVCYYYSTNNNSTKSIQNPQALAAAALYKNANKDNFNYAGKYGTCTAGRAGMCCYYTSESGKHTHYGACSLFGNCVGDNPGYSCEYAWDNQGD